MDIISIDGSTRDVLQASSYPAVHNKLSLLLAPKSAKPEGLRGIEIDPAVLEVRIAASSEASRRAHHENTTKIEDYSQTSNFESIVRRQSAALLSLTPSQFNLLMKFTETLRQQRLNIQKQLECAFCKNNGEMASWYSTHSLKDSKGRVRCPVLRGYRCPRCGAGGDRAHTIRYCPKSNFDRFRYHTS